MTKKIVITIYFTIIQKRAHKHVIVMTKRTQVKTVSKALCLYMYMQFTVNARLISFTCFLLKF